MIGQDFHYLSSDRKTKIHFREWLPERYLKAVVQISHGITEHIGRYGKLAYALVENGYAVVGNDHMGHGLYVLPGGKFAGTIQATASAGSPVL